jgi:hypothetical protein
MVTATEDDDPAPAAPPTAVPTAAPTKAIAMRA